MSYLEFGKGDISPCSFTFRQAFHCPPKPPFSWFAQATAWARVITCTLCQGLQEFHCTSCQRLEKFTELFIWKSDFHFSFFCYCAEVIIKNVDNFLRVCDCFIVLWQKMNLWWSRLFPGHQISDSLPSIFYIIHVSFKEFIIFFFTFLDYSWKEVSVVPVFIMCFSFLHRVFQFNAFLKQRIFN